MDASAMVCKSCSRANGEKADRDGADLEVLNLEFEDFSNDKAGRNVAQQYFKDQIAQEKFSPKLHHAQWKLRMDICVFWALEQCSGAGSIFHNHES